MGVVAWSNPRRSYELNSTTFVIVVLAAVVILLVILNRERGKKGADQLQQEINSLRKELGEHLSNVTQQVHSATGQMGDVRHHLGVLEKSAEQIFEVGKNIATLQEILQAPKLRGGLGEMLLADLLAQILPSKHFRLQYQFRGGRVDAVVSLGERLIPIDAKFPLENFRRLRDAKSDVDETAFRRRLAADVRKHVDSIAEKYILPDQGTYDFALMYIPAENVYYETIIKYGQVGDEKSISDYALRKKVIPVSPNTLYAYLQVIVLGLRGLRIDERAQEILAHLVSLHGEMEKFRKDFELVGGHLDNAKNRYEEARIKLSRFADKLTDLESPTEETD